MTTQPTRTGRLEAWMLAAALALLLSALAAVLTPLPTVAQEDEISLGVEIPGDLDGGRLELEDAQLRWGLNAESGNGAFFGGCNFLSAGAAGDKGGSVVWSDDDARGDDPLYRSRAGQVRIEKPTADGGWEIQTWQNKCLAPDGGSVMPPSANSVSGATVVMEGGTGLVDTDEHTAEIAWEGAATVVFYGGMTYWWFADPVLTVQPDGSGELTATAGGYGASMDDPSLWVELEAREVTMATFSGARFGEDGLAVTPHYRGVEIEILPGGPSGPQVREGSDWGSFPKDFVDFHAETGQAAYWYASGGIVDRHKPATPIWVSYDVSRPVDPGYVPPEPSPAIPPPGLGGGSAGDQSAESGRTGADLPSAAGALPGSGSGAGGGLGPGGSGAAEDPGEAEDPGRAELLEPTGVLPAAYEWLTADGLIGIAAESFADPRARLMVALGAVGLLSGTAFLGFRRGWLQLPWSSP